MKPKFLTFGFGSPAEMERLIKVFPADFFGYIPKSEFTKQGGLFTRHQQSNLCSYFYGGKRIRSEYSINGAVARYKNSSYIPFTIAEILAQYVQRGWEILGVSEGVPEMESGYENYYYMVFKEGGFSMIIPNSMNFNDVGSIYLRKKKGW